MGLLVIGDPVQINTCLNSDVDHDEYAFCDFGL